LLNDDEIDIRSALRQGVSDAVLSSLLLQAVSRNPRDTIWSAVSRPKNG